MKRDFLSVVRFVVPAVLACIALAISTGMFTVASPKPAWAGLHDAPATPYRNVIVVARSGGDFTSIQQALNSITDNSATNPYLVWVAPGIYTERVTMKPYVDIEGAGELVTKITSTGSLTPTLATVVGANDAELRDLTVENTGGNYNATAIYTQGSSPSFAHLTVTASGGSGANRAFYIYGIRSSGGLGSPTLRNVTAIASGWSASSHLTNYGLYNEDGASPIVTDSVITASSWPYGGYENYAMWNFASSATIWNSKLSATSAGPGANIAIKADTYHGTYNLTIDNSTLVGSTNTILGACCNSISYTIRVGASRLEGGPVQVRTGTATCAGVYDEKYTFFPNTCP